LRFLKIRIFLQKGLDRFLVICPSGSSRAVLGGAVYQAPRFGRRPVRRLWAEADISLPKTSAESVENDPQRIWVRVDFACS
jgi:hypothetical protein